MSPGPTTLESRLAQLIRVTCSDREGEVISAIHAIVRTLKAAGTDKIHALADRVEKPIEKPTATPSTRPRRGDSTMRVMPPVCGRQRVSITE
jgi:hypothetical protein